MKEIKCPECGKVFTIDEGAYADILNQVRNEILEKEIKEREEALKATYSEKIKTMAAEQESRIQKENAAYVAKITKLENELQNEQGRRKQDISLALAEKEKEIIELKGKVQNGEKDAALKVNEAIQKEADKINALKLECEKLKASIESDKKAHELELESKAKEQKLLLKEKDEEIAFYKDFKAKMSVKLLGEDLEQHCMNLFNQNRTTAFPNATFEKDNEVIEGTKGDFIFRDKDENGTQFISIMFDMKNEADVSKTKHKNEDFFAKLDSDRKKKDCEYAVLVSMLEPENEFYNAGIVDVSYRYDKMYVVRPQFFLPIISLLRNANRKTATTLAELYDERRKNADVTNFENELQAFQKDFGGNVALYRKHYDEMLKRLDSTIEQLEKVREELRKADNNLRIADNKLQQISVRKLAKNSPSLISKMDAIDDEEK